MNADQLAAILERSQGRPYTITVYCNEPSHDGKRRDRGEFVLDIEQRPPRWFFSPFRDNKRLRGAAAVTVRLVGDRYVRRDESPLVFDQPGAEPRTNYEFECDVCGLKLEWHADIVHPALDTLAANGFQEASIKLLAAIIERSS